MTDDILLTVQEEPDITLEYVEAAIKPETVGHVTPKRQAQTVYPASGTVFGSVEVDPMPNPVLQNTSITPTKQKQTATADSGFDGLGTVEVEPIPSEYIIPQGKTIITQNGTVNVSQYAEAEVDVSDKPSIGFVFGNFDARGCPHSMTTYGYTELEAWFFYRCGYNEYSRANFRMNIQELHLNEGLVKIQDYNFRDNKPVERIFFPSTLATLGGVYQFSGSNNLQLLDFSRCTQVVTLTSTLGFGIQSGCVIRVPQSLLAEWQAATNWNALVTDVVWEGV